MDGSGSARPFLQTNSYEFSPEFSSGTRWLAYVSTESGRRDVYVQRYPEKGGKKLISTAGGRSPVWSRRGDELFYLTSSGSRTKYWAVDIKISGDTLTAGNPVFLFEKECVRTSPHRSYDVAPDSQHFLMVSQNRAKEQAMWRDYFGKKVNIVLNWSEELRRLAPKEVSSRGNSASQQGRERLGQLVIGGQVLRRERNTIPTTDRDVALASSPNYSFFEPSARGRRPGDHRYRSDERFP